MTEPPPPVQGSQPTFPPPPPSPWQPPTGLSRDELAMSFLMYLGTQALASRVYVERLYFLLTADERVRANVECIPDREPPRPPPQSATAPPPPASPPPPPADAGVMGSIGFVSEEVLREHGRDVVTHLLRRLLFGGG